MFKELLFKIPFVTYENTPANKNMLIVDNEKDNRTASFNII